VTTDADALARKVRQAARAIGRHGLAHAYGHCSTRLDAENFIVCPPRPMGLIAQDEPCTIVSLDGPLPTGVLGEVRIHREIYRRRSDVGGIVRSMPPRTMSLGVMKRLPRAMHGFGSYFHNAAALWDDPQLLRSDESAAALADLLRDGRAVVMRGNGLVVAGSSLEEAVVLTWYMEDAARLELDVLAAGVEPAVLSAEECARRAIWDGQIRERMWGWLTAGDAEG
jgi:HCOMODA/2-hydroxy-3-carboxy-muconic semialdehyde decarboxylase